VLVAREVARLASVVPSHPGSPATAIELTGNDDAEAAMAPDALKQVLLNLLQNSRDASTSDGPVNIRIATAIVGSRVVIDVLDDGPGIPPDILHRVFDPFFTTKDAVHGVGLGLFVAEGLVRAAGGSIAARNARDDSGTAYRGAWFHIELPVPAEPTTTTRHGAATPNAAGRVSASISD
jgi:signal transduction histidine kinase